MTLRDLLPHLDNPVASGSLDTEITDFAYDSRKAGPGIAFVALRGSFTLRARMAGGTA